MEYMFLMIAFERAPLISCHNKSGGGRFHWIVAVKKLDEQITSAEIEKRDANL
jgi:hypothetical protein